MEIFPEDKADPDWDWKRLECTGWSPSERKQKLDQFRNYVDLMEQYNRYQGALQFLLGVAILIYFLRSILQRRKLTSF